MVEVRVINTPPPKQFLQVILYLYIVILITILLYIYNKDKNEYICRDPKKFIM